MEYSTNVVSLRFYWYDRPMMVREYIEWINGLLKVLRNKNSVFSKIHIVSKKKNDTLIESDGSNLERLVLPSLDREVAYINEVSTNKRATLTSYCVSGFINSFITTLNNDEPGIWIRMLIGRKSKDAANALIIEVSESLCSSKFLKDLFETVIDYSQPMHANAIRVGVAEALPQRVGAIHVGWLTYLNKVVSAECFPGGCTVSEFSNGSLIQTSEQPAHLEEVDKTANIKLVIDILKSKGMLNTPLVTL